MRKPDQTIVFGSQGAALVSPDGPVTQRMPQATYVPASQSPPSLAPSSVRMRPLSEDLVDERVYMSRPERGLAFAAISLALVGVAAAGTYFFLGSRTPEVSTTSTTSAEVPAQTATTPTPNPTPAPAATPADQPWDKPEVDAVRAPSLAREIRGPQALPTERPQAENQAPAQPVPKRVTTPRTPPPGMSDEALERAGFYGNLLPKPGSESAPKNDEPKSPSAASTEEPKQFSPPPSPSPAPSEVMPGVQIKE